MLEFFNFISGSKNLELVVKIIIYLKWFHDDLKLNFFVLTLGPVDGYWRELSPLCA